MHNTFDFADPSARGGRRGRQLSLRVIKRAKKEKRRREEREKKEVGHERMVIKRIAVISLPVALTFASVDEFNRYHFAWKRASERASRQPRQPAAMGIPMRRFSTRANRLLFNLRGAGTVAFNLLYTPVSR